MNLDEMVIRSHPGNGLVGRFPGVAIVAVPSSVEHDAVLTHLLALAESAATTGPMPGRRLARQVAGLLGSTEPDEVPAFGLLAQAEAGLVIILHGAMDAEVTWPQGKEHLSGNLVATWVDRILPPPIIGLIVAPSGPQPRTPDPRSRLLAGVVAGSGLTVVPVGAVLAAAPVAPVPAPVADPAAYAAPIDPAPWAPAPPPEPIHAPTPPPEPPAPAPPPLVEPVPPPVEPAPPAAPASPVEPAPKPTAAPPPPVEPTPWPPAAAEPAPAPWPAPPTPDWPPPEAGSVLLPPAAAEEQEPTVLAGAAAPPPPSVGEEPVLAEPRAFVAVALAEPDSEPEEVREPLPIAGDRAHVHEEPAGPRVRGVICSRGHFNDPAAPFCGVCGISMVQRTLNLVDGPRPPLGVIVFDDGATFTLDSDYVLGREPENDPAVMSGDARPLAMADPDRTVSRVHAGLILDGWDVKAVDRGSANGTFIAAPGEEHWVALLPNRPTAIKPGTRIRLGQRIFLYDSHQGTR